MLTERKLRRNQEVIFDEILLGAHSFNTQLPGQIRNGDNVIYNVTEDKGTKHH